MTDYHNADSVRATVANYHEALRQLFDISPHLVPINTQWGDPLPTQWRLYAMSNGLQRHATQVNAGCHGLTLNNPGHASFFSVWAYFKTSFVQVGWNKAAAGMPADADGHGQGPEKMTCRRVYLSLAVYEHAWTAEQFVNHEAEIRTLFDEAGDEVRGAYRQAVAHARAEIDTYNTLLAQFKPLVKAD